MSEGIKADDGKPRFDLLPWPALAACQRVFEHGGRKYAAWNYARGMAWLRLWNAAMRHLTAWALGEDNDPETGESHLTHAACSVLMLLTLVTLKRGKDDREPFPQSSPPDETPTDNHLK